MSRDTIYDRFIDCQWWTDVDKRRVDIWLKNFGLEKEIGKIILDNIFFYSKEQLDSYTKNIINQIKAEIFKKHQINNGRTYNDDAYYFKQWEGYKQYLKVMPAAKSGDVSCSAYEVIRRYRPILGNDLVSDKYSIEEGIDNLVRDFIFVDDFSGSGNQMIKFMETMISVHGKKIRICDLPLEYSNITITIAVYVIHSDALTLLNNKYPHIKIRYVDLIDKKLDFLNYDCIFYNKLSDEKRTRIIEYISQKREEIIREEPKYKDLMKYQLNIPIVFCHGCPNNALLLLFAETNNWKQIFKLGEEL